MSEPTPRLMVVLCFRDAAPTLARAIESILGQVGVSGRVELLLVNDGSTDGWRDVIAPYLGHPGLHLQTVDCGTAAEARNAGLDLVDSFHPEIDYICRLDADDCLATNGVLATVLDHLTKTRPDALLGGNWQILDGVRLPVPNRASARLTEPGFLLARLQRMADGDTGAELPSCNLVLRRGLGLRYPVLPSAEDHGLLVEILLRPDRYRLCIVEELLYCDYTLSGRATEQARRADAYRQARLALLERARVSLAPRGTA